MTLNKQIGKNLELFRKKRGLSQEDVAAYLGVSRPVISYYETATREIPLPQLEKLADLYCVDVADLIEEQTTVEQQASVAFAFRTDGLTPEDLQNMGNFQKVVKNYLKLKKLEHEAQQGSRS